MPKNWGGNALPAFRTIWVNLTIYLKMIYNKKDPIKGGLYHIHNGYLAVYREIKGVRKHIKCHVWFMEKILGRKLSHAGLKKPRK